MLFCAPERTNQESPWGRHPSIQQHQVLLIGISGFSRLCLHVSMPTHHLSPARNHTYYRRLRLYLVPFVPPYLSLSDLKRSFHFLKVCTYAENNYQANLHRIFTLHLDRPGFGLNHLLETRRLLVFAGRIRLRELFKESHMWWPITIVMENQI